jgi:hypothetical protein
MGHRAKGSTPVLRCGPRSNELKKSPMVSPRDVTALLGDWNRGDRAAMSRLLPLVCAELRRAAAGGDE